MGLTIGCDGDCRCFICITARNAEYQARIATQLAEIRAAETAEERETREAYERLMYG